MSNITQVVNNEKKLSTLSKGVKATGLDQVLSGSGPFTIFAPSDLAFEKLESNFMDGMFKPDNMGQLTDLLKHHILNSKLDFKDFKDGEKLETMDGRSVTVKARNGTISIDGAVIQNRDMKTSNGVIHSIDTVLQN